MTQPATVDAWPSLPLGAWSDTYETLRRWLQVVGKVRLALAPPLNHWWHVPLYVTTHGLTTSPIPYDDGRNFQIDVDLTGHRLSIEVDDGSRRSFALSAFSVADFYQRLMTELAELGLPVRIWSRPVELETAVPFERDRDHAAYAPEYANRAWRILLHTDRVLDEFRGGFTGKASPVHFFWGGFDLALTLFSGRPAPPHPGGIPNVGDWVMREAYSHECASMGFWPGGGAVPEPAFYAYAYPEPKGYRDHAVQPEQAFFHAEMGEYILRYEDVRRAADPDRLLLSFFRSTFRAAATLAAWDRASLERDLTTFGRRVDVRNRQIGA